MKVTIRSAKMDKAGLHNDRNFDVESSDHIDKNRIGLNKYYTYNGDESMTFLELEKEFYREHFSDYVNAQNERNTRAGHKERNQTIEDYYYNKRTRPEDVILQIGDMNEHATTDELWSCAMKYKDKFNEMFGDHCQILDMALHDDEATPHVHIRRVWISDDKRGDKFVNSAKCLEEMGIPLPDESRSKDRYNNLKMTFSKMDREMFIDICEREGFVIERPTGEKQKHLSLDEFKNMKNSQIDFDAFQRDFEAIQRRIEESLQFALRNEKIRKKYQKELDEIEEKSLPEKMDLVRDLTPEIQSELPKYDSSFEVEMEAARLRSEIEKKEKEISKIKKESEEKLDIIKNEYEEFLSQKGLLNEFKNTTQNKDKEHTKKWQDERENTTPIETYF